MKDISIHVHLKDVNFLLWYKIHLWQVLCVNSHQSTAGWPLNVKNPITPWAGVVGVFKALDKERDKAAAKKQSGIQRVAT